MRKTVFFSVISGLSGAGGFIGKVAGGLICIDHRTGLICVAVVVGRVVLSDYIVAVIKHRIVVCRICQIPAIRNKNCYKLVTEVEHTLTLLQPECRPADDIKRLKTCTISKHRVHIQDRRSVPWAEVDIL